MKQAGGQHLREPCCEMFHRPMEAPSSREKKGTKHDKILYHRLDRGRPTRNFKLTRIKHPIIDQLATDGKDSE